MPFLRFFWEGFNTFHFRLSFSDGVDARVCFCLYGLDCGSFRFVVPVNLPEPGQWAWAKQPVLPGFRSIVGQDN